MMKKSSHILLPALLFMSCQQVNAAEAIYRDTAYSGSATGERCITFPSSYYYIRASKNQVCYTLSGQIPAGDVIARDLASTQVMVVARARSFDGLYDDAKYMEYRQGKNKD